MVDIKKEVVVALRQVLPTYYELFLDDKAEIPCISYIESTNRDDKVTKEFGSSEIKYTVKVWAKSVDDASKYSKQVDTVLRAIGFRRNGSYEMTNNNLICKILTYRAVAIERY